MERKPLLRGWSHVLAAVGAVLFTGALAVRCADDPPRLAGLRAAAASVADRQFRAAVVVEPLLARLPTRD